VRWEGIRTLSESALASAQNSSNVLTPLFHSVWRLTQESKDQIRLGLTRSYRAPTLANLIAVPTLSTNYPASGSNTSTSPDRVGNPNLKPELAAGLDLAFEHYFTAGGLLSASVFRRNIDDLIRNVTSLQTVNWSPQQRWVSTPVNFGHATTHGMELEAKFRLDELLKEAPELSLRANYSRFWSNVEDVPGPDNRLDQQPRQTANFGVDYRLHDMPLTLGGNINWTPAFAVQQTDAQIYYQGIKRVFDAYALWKFDPNTQLRLSASNLRHANYDTANREIFSGTDQIAETIQKTFLALAARLEIKF
jgi:iron complex outermembrane receptor protein